MTWKPPTSNGGSNITGYDVERRDVLGGRWIRVTTRPVAGTTYHDTDVEANHQGRGSMEFQQDFQLRF